MRMHIYEETVYDNSGYTDDKGYICDDCLARAKREATITTHDDDGTLVLITRGDGIVDVLRVDNPAQYLDACETLQSQACDCWYHGIKVVAA